MKQLKEFLIPFVGLKVGKHQFDYYIDRTFFDSFEFDEYENCDVDVNVVLDKKSTFMELHFSHNGTVLVPCDISGEMFDMEIEGALKLVVQFGDEFNNDNEELLILPHGEYEIDLSQYIYEMIVLSVPLKRVHPRVLDGSIVVEGLLSTEPEEEEETNEGKEEETDPRWDKLKNLLTDK